METTLLPKSKKCVGPPSKFERLVQPCIAEMVGTAFFVFIGCKSVIENTEATGRFQPALVLTTREKYAQATGAAFTVLQSEDHLGAAIFGEAAMTCLVTLVVLMGAVNRKSKSPLVPFLVGGAIVICVLAGGDVSGTCLNPARALGPAVITNYWAHHWVYWAGPTGGSLVAAAVVRLLLGDEKTRVILK
ncbi:aquaporin-8-like [Anguilla anguilla]|uniref:aquaporin-8-like n=1 Tax=Anguilla anguilla TaxID=7936 RepID=UPI0015B1DD63|nr:aquaporin-8-like [Anguilla anguilla]